MFNSDVASCATSNPPQGQQLNTATAPSGSTGSGVGDSTTPQARRGVADRAIASQCAGCGRSRPSPWRPIPVLADPGYAP